MIRYGVNINNGYKLYINENKNCGSLESFKTELENFNINIENNMIKNYELIILLIERNSLER